MSIAKHYPDLNAGWLLTGEGEYELQQAKRKEAVKELREIFKLSDNKQMLHSFDSIETVIDNLY